VAIAVEPAHREREAGVGTQRGEQPGAVGLPALQLESNLDAGDDVQLGSALSG